MNNNAVLDQDWVVLMKEAKSMGLTVEEVREFFENFNHSQLSLEGRKTS